MTYRSKPKKVIRSDGLELTTLRGSEKGAFDWEVNVLRNPEVSASFRRTILMSAGYLDPTGNTLCNTSEANARAGNPSAVISYLNRRNPRHTREQRMMALLAASGQIVDDLDVRELILYGQSMSGVSDVDAAIANSRLSKDERLPLQALIIEDGAGALGPLRIHPVNLAKAVAIEGVALALHPTTVVSLAKNEIASRLRRPRIPFLDQLVELDELCWLRGVDVSSDIEALRQGDDGIPVNIIHGTQDYVVPARGGYEEHPHTIRLGGRTHMTFMFANASFGQILEDQLFGQVA